MYRKYIKRAFDVFFAIALLPFVGVVIAVAGFLIWLEDRGPIFYNSKRVGQAGAVFIMYKLRTMKVNAPDIRNEDGSTFNSATDPRLTRIGKLLRQTSVDELPQIVNIIKGEMSFVGPRPDLPEQSALYVGDEERKLLVRPGVTGYNQAYYRNTVSWKARIRHDMYYVDHLSIWMDTKILLATAVSVMKSNDIYMRQPSNASQGIIKSPEREIEG